MSNNASVFSMNLHFSPLIADQLLWAIILIGAMLFILSFIKYRHGILIRGAMFGLFILALSNPSVVKEERNYVRDVATIVVDKSDSQNFGQRSERAQTALSFLQQQIEENGAFDLRIVEAPLDGLSSRTDLFGALDQALSDVPQKRRAGIIFLSDGQIHDVQKDESLYQSYGPVHALLTGEKGEKDRQIIITNAPAYGLVGENIMVKFRVEDTKNIGQNNAEITITGHDGTQRNFYVPIGIEQSLPLPMDHPSQNIFTLEVAGVKDEITLANNKTAVIINGVRDRMKVLLVSGIPHTGERTWRDLLTSDPGVDLVHFTILREPEKFDYTPKKEMSLIAFPFQELFEVKLYDFDLIIFDRYRVNNILPRRYFDNIARYVQEGGAFLEASGPAFANRGQSIYNTPLGTILPARPTGEVLEQRFTPTITALGKHHPVTESLVWTTDMTADKTAAPWGSWMRYIDIEPSHGDVLMDAMDNKPLLVLDRVGKGRVAQLASDHIWLWSRGYDGGGPHAELLRRIVHWLMKEPQLDERALEVSVHKSMITIRKRGYDSTTETISMRDPNGEQSLIELKAKSDGILEEKIKADALGIYAFEDTNGARKFAIIGDIAPLELRAVKTSDDKLAPLINASKGTTIWLSDTPRPKISEADANARRFGGSDWLALKHNQDFTVTGVKDIALLPDWATLILLISALISLWWYEGRGRVS